MTLGDLIDAFRDEAQDNTRPYLWSDARLTRFAVESMHEACRRSGVLVDSQSAFCLVTATSADPLVPIDPRIITIKRIARTDRPALSMLPMRCSDMDRLVPGWESATAADPDWYVTDYQTGYLRIVPTPTADIEFQMTVSRLPLSAPKSLDDAIEFRDEYAPALVQWMLYRAYSKQDADSFDPAKAARSLAEFEREFGRKVSARNAQWQQEQPQMLFYPLA